MVQGDPIDTMWVHLEGDQAEMQHLACDERERCLMAAGDGARVLPEALKELAEKLDTTHKKQVSLKSFTPFFFGINM